MRGACEGGVLLLLTVLELGILVKRVLIGILNDLVEFVVVERRGLRLVLGVVHWGRKVRGLLRRGRLRENRVLGVEQVLDSFTQLILVDLLI